MKRDSTLFNGEAKNHSLKFLLTGLATLLTLGVFAQGQGVVETDSPYWMFSNALFNVLLGVIVFLLIVIAVLGGVLKGVGEVTLNNSKKNQNKSAGIIGLIFFSSISTDTFAQNSGLASSSYSDLPAGLFFLMLTIISLEIIAILVLVTSIKLLIKNEDKELEAIAAEEPSLLEKWNASVPLEKEADVMMDHEYDGIRELDNDLPPWWKYGFYFSIVAAFAYIINYHVIRTGDLQEAEYNKSIAAAKIAKEEYAKKSASNVDENSVTMLTDIADIEKGKKIFGELCATCHGKEAAGNAGPNLTDSYWLHGGSLKDVFSSIKYGWEDKGMIAWQSQLSPIEIHQVASFIKTLTEIKPPLGKEPQGELYEDAMAPAIDTLQGDGVSVKMDSMQVQ